MALSGKVVRLQSSDGIFITYPYEYVVFSSTIKNMLDDLPEAAVDDEDNNFIPLHNVNIDQIQKVMEWCETAFKSGSSGTESKESVRERQLAEWETAYVVDLNMDSTIQLLLAANYLDIKSLLYLVAKSMAQKLEGKTPPQIRELFGISAEFTPAEIEAIKRERGLLPPKDDESNTENKHDDEVSSSQKTDGGNRRLDE